MHGLEEFYKVNMVLSSIYDYFKKKKKREGMVVPCHRYTFHNTTENQIPHFPFHQSDCQIIIFTM